MSKIPAKQARVMQAIITAMKKKEADLDMMDDQLLGMDAVLPADTMSNDFDMLAQKRNELEENIRKMRERIELISAWEQLKNGDWSEEVKSLLKDLDLNIAEIADNAPGAQQPPTMMADPMMAPPAPLVPPAAPVAMPPAPASVPPPVPSPEVEPEVTEELPTESPETEELPAPMASSKESNYEVQVKKADSTPSTLTKGTTMTQTASKPSLKQELVTAKSKSDIKKAAQTRIAAAVTLAKTMLPNAPLAIQTKFASTLLQNSTKVLTAALRQTAINAYATKMAEDIKRKHKMELNDLLEEPSILTSAKREVESEIKGDAKNAGKVADDRKDAGPQNDTYNDGRGCGGGKHTEPAEIDAGKAGNRPANTINKSEESEKTLTAAAKTACVGAECKGCPNCKKEATAKKADEMPMMPPPAEGMAPEAPPAPPAPPAPAMDAPAPEMGEPGAAAEGATVLTEEKKMDMTEKIDEAEQAIQGLLADIEGENSAAEEGVAEMAELPGEELPGGEEGAGEELKIEDMFDQGTMEDKEGSLANQNDDNNSIMADGDSMESFFAPSSSQELESSLEPQMASIESMFSVEGSDADPMAVLFGGKDAGSVAGFDILPAFTSETANHFESDTAKGETRDSQSDHESDIWAEALTSIGFEEQGTKRDKQDSAPELKNSPEGKKAGKTAAYTGPIRPTAPKTSSVADAGEALMGSFFGDEPDAN